MRACPKSIVLNQFISCLLRAQDQFQSSFAAAANNEPEMVAFPRLGGIVPLVLSAYYALSTSGAIVIHPATSLDIGANASVSMPPSNARPSCVNTTRYPQWGGAPNPRINRDCYKAMRYIMKRVQENLESPYEFFSRQTFPGQRPTQSFPLPQGVGVGMSPMVGLKILNSRKEYRSRDVNVPN